jgi:hypothetical protein
MRLAALLLVLVAFAGCRTAGPTGGEVRIARLDPGYRTVASFQRLSEFLTGRENTGGETVLRSRDADRAGYYWSLRLVNPGPAVAEAMFELEVITPADPEPRSRLFVAAVPAGSQVFNLGLTGSDWPDATAAPVAWRLRVNARDGTALRPLASAQSFLWDKPAGQVGK